MLCWFLPYNNEISHDGGLVAKSCPTLVTPQTIAHQAPLSIVFSRQEYWNGVPFTSPGDLPDPSSIPGSLALQADSLPTELREKPTSVIITYIPPPSCTFSHSLPFSTFRSSQSPRVGYPHYTATSNQPSILPVRWMHLETAKQSKVSQKEKNKYYIVMHGIQKNGIDEPVCREGMETQMCSLHF